MHRVLQVKYFHLLDIVVILTERSTKVIFKEQSFNEDGDNPRGKETRIFFNEPCWKNDRKKKTGF